MSEHARPTPSFARVRRFWLLLGLLFGCAHQPAYLQPLPETPLRTLTRMVVGTCATQWSEALVAQSELKLRRCLDENSRSFAYCLHELCDEVWPEPEAM